MISLTATLFVLLCTVGQGNRAGPELFNEHHLPFLHEISPSEYVKEGVSGPLITTTFVTPSEGPLDIQVVLGREQHPVSHLVWLTHYKHIIYNRGGASGFIVNGSKLPLHQVPQRRGVFTNAYLIHIIENYDKLASVTIFAQASQQWKTYTNSMFQKDVQAIKDGTIKFAPENDGFMFLVPNCISVAEEFGDETKSRRWFEEVFGKDSHLVIENGFKDVTNVYDDPQYFRFSPTGCFAVLKEAIHRQPMEYYQHLLKVLTFDDEPIMAHFFERAWPQVFHSKCTSGKQYNCYYNLDTECDCAHYMPWNQHACSNDINEPSSRTNITFPSHRSHMQVVISRFEEEVQPLLWLHAYPHVIYNRGSNTLFKTEDGSDWLPLNMVRFERNVGRESFIYLSHIIENYDRLANITIFSQAMQSYLNYTKELFQRDVHAFATGEHHFIPENDGFMFLIPECRSVWEGPYWVAWFDSIFGLGQHFRIDDGYKDIVNFTKNRKFYRFAPTGLFAVTREAIHRRPVGDYQRMLVSLSHQNNPPIGHFFERSWPAVFQSTCTSNEAYYCTPYHNLTLTCDCIFPSFWNWAYFTHNCPTIYDADWHNWSNDTTVLPELEDDDSISHIANNAEGKLDSSSGSLSRSRSGKVVQLRNIEVARD